MLSMIAGPLVCGHEHPYADSVVQLVQGRQGLLVKKGKLVEQIPRTAGLETYAAELIFSA